MFFHCLQGYVHELYLHKGLELQPLTWTEQQLLLGYIVQLGDSNNRHLDQLLLQYRRDLLHFLDFLFGLKLQQLELVKVFPLFLISDTLESTLDLLHVFQLKKLVLELVQEFPVLFFEPFSPPMQLKTGVRR